MFLLVDNVMFLLISGDITLYGVGSNIILKTPDSTIIFKKVSSITSSGLGLNVKQPISEIIIKNVSSILSIEDTHSQIVIKKINSEKSSLTIIAESVEVIEVFSNITLKTICSTSIIKKVSSLIEDKSIQSDMTNFREEI